MKRRAKKKNIKVYEKWLNSYSAFKKWAMDNRYVEGKVALVRIDEALGFKPSNCIFVDKYNHMKTHGGSTTKLYTLWINMRQKCNNPTHKQFRLYGAKGIKVATEWDNFEDFQRWAKLNRYQEGLLLDRKDLSGDFIPSNCIFVKRSEHSIVKQSPIINSGKDNHQYKHGMKNTRIYNIWDTMKQRCLNSKQKDYKNYGGRGIKACEEWLEFNNFYNWSKANGYRNDLSLERVNVNGNYEPSNCIWITMKEQARNTRRNHFYTYNGESKTIAEWSELSGIPPKTLRYRIINNWDAEDIFSPRNRGMKRKKTK